MEFKFERFEKIGGRYNNYSISISTSYGIGFNAGFYHKENVKLYKYVVLFYDKKRKAIGFLFTNNEKEKGVFKISHVKNSSGLTVARSFFNANQIDVKSNKGRYEPKIAEDGTSGRLYYISLK